jgi:hypothetical protein
MLSKNIFPIFWVPLENRARCKNADKIFFEEMFTFCPLLIQEHLQF